MRRPGGHVKSSLARRPGQAPVLGAATGSAVATARIGATLPGTDPVLSSNVDRCATDFLTAGGCGSPDIWDLSGREVADVRTVEACSALSAGGFEVLPTGEVTFRAGEGVELGNDFAVRESLGRDPAGSRPQHTTSARDPRLARQPELSAAQ